MKYIINGVVKYNPSTDTLHSLDNRVDLITLARSTSELFLLLLNHNGTPLSRESILNELWEKRGLSASSNNLNNYVSMLRKALLQCGCPDLITTIPKYGFLFEAEVVTVVENDSIPEEKQPTKNSHLEVPEVLTNHQVLQKRSYRPRFFMSRKAKVIAIMLSLLVIYFSPGIYNHSRLQSVRTEVFRLDQCHFYITDDKTRRMDNISIINSIKVIAKNEKLDCKRQANVYYFADKKLDASGHVIMSDLLSYCPFNSNAPCDNYYLSTHENQDENES